LYNTKTNKITGFTPTIQEDVDVVFALSVDPLAMGYPFLSPYNFSANSPILLKDADGRVIIIHYMDEKNKQQTVVLEKVTDIQTYLNDNNNFVRAVAKNLKKINDSGVPTVADAIECTKETVHIYYRKQTHSLDIDKKSNAFFEKGNLGFTENTIFFDPEWTSAIISDEVIEQLKNLNSQKYSPNTSPEMAAGLNNQMNYIKKKAKPIGWITPDEVLQHELSHFLDFVENSEQFYLDYNTPDDKMDRKSELKIIQGPEKDYRSTKELPERTNHYTIKEKGKRENLKIDKDGKNKR